MVRSAPIAPILAFVLSASGASSQPAAIDVSVAARSIQPGELIVLTITPRRAATAVDVNVFGKQFRAFPAGDGVWRALVGIDVLQKPDSYTMEIDARMPAVVRTTQALVVRPKQFPTRSLRVDPDFVNPPAAVVARITSEATFVRAELSRVTPQRLWEQAFVRPVPGQANSQFGTRSVYNGEARSPHSGADFSSAAGTPVRAPNAGRVVAARDLYFTGNTVILDHGLGVLSLLAHLSRIDVTEGETVSAGQIVGLVGATGRVTGPHLHWGLTVSGARVDPLSALTLLGDHSQTEAR
jgi:murein DD-endopeptidase MepM/ murein hydrolase activator NlpD